MINKEEYALIQQLQQRVMELQQNEQLLTIQLEGASAFNHSILDALPIDIFLHDELGKTVFMNKEGCKRHGKPLHELVGKTVYDFFPKQIADVLRKDDLKVWQTKTQLIKSVKVEFSGKPVHLLTGKSIVRENQTNKEYLLGYALDVTKQIQAEEQVEHIVYHDSLTGLPNRWYIEQNGEEYLQDTEGCAAMLLLDLDHFKVINDSMGHQAGDLLLQKVASRLKELEEKNIMLARLGGDEFVFILKGVYGIDKICDFNEKIIQILSKPFTVEEKQVTITPSIGISLYPKDATTIFSMIKNADIAMYHLKEKGRNGYQFFTDNMKESANHRMDMEILLRQAIDKEEFILHYQPKLHLGTGKIYGVEALVRWDSPDHGLLYPGSFIELAEETGLIVPLGEWVLREACRQCREWHDLGYKDLTISVNVSAQQFRKRDLEETVKDVLETTGLDPKALELELTESTVMENPVEAAAALKRLQKMGISISIDDFGTGFSSLNYLKHFPINTLKIDRSFIQNAEKDNADAAITLAVITLAHNLNLSVVAEVVENELQLDFVTNARCNGGQGYFISRPLDREAMIEYLRINEGGR
ncbi:diguanylate cyclase (GGDEF)-like protein/PAS domain S-box-containing protein [Bacillus ectoiniformans]|uniref:sensor domain-containing protein n=1 Tax=Bacillus ectoiniformans TaxID=1494429 RepID=UPI00195BDC2A|nr:EAL domain-containing protein [Bacillus ectoiniformans]MBM7648253.1 diguanylate cyclase (GGDEF)-like protein/PAS domain S-box-containing protein [Bacillus ectoiniformans]